MANDITAKQLASEIKQLIEQSRQNAAVAVNAEINKLRKLRGETAKELLKTEQKLSPELVFKDPYFLDFLGLKDNFSEKDLESARKAKMRRSASCSAPKKAMK